MHVSPPTSFLRLSFPPLKSLGSSFDVFILDGPTPLVFPMFYSSYEVSSFGKRIKISYSNVGMTFHYTKLHFSPLWVSLGFK